MSDRPPDRAPPAPPPRRRRASSTEPAPEPTPPPQQPSSDEAPAPAPAAPAPASGAQGEVAVDNKALEELGAQLFEGFMRVAYGVFCLVIGFVTAAVNAIRPKALEAPKQLLKAGGFGGFQHSQSNDDDDSSKIGRLLFHIERASNLPVADIGGSTDAYVRIIVGKHKPKKTHVVKGLNPVWNSKLFMEARSDSEQEILLQVMDRDRGRIDDVLGVVKIPVKRVVDAYVNNEMVQGEFKIVGSKGNNLSHKGKESLLKVSIGFTLDRGAPGAEWLNGCIQKMFRVLQPDIDKLFKTTANEVLKVLVIPNVMVIESIVLEEFSVGSNAPWLMAIDVLETCSDNDLQSMVRFRWVAHGNTSTESSEDQKNLVVKLKVATKKMMGLGITLTVSVTDIEVEFPAWCQLRVESGASGMGIPGNPLTAFAIRATEDPQIKFRCSIDGVADTSSVPGLEDAIYFVIQTVLRSYLVNQKLELIKNPDPLPVPEERTGAVGRLCIKVLEAERLPKMDRMGKADPYCTLWVGTSVTKTTKTIKNTLDPKWNEYVELYVKNPETDTLWVQVWDKDWGSPDDLIGQVSISVTEMSREAGWKELWYPIAKAKSGRVRIATCYCPFVPPEGPIFGDPSKPPKEQVKASSGTQPSAPSPPKPIALSVAVRKVGRMTVRIIKARNVPKMDTFGKVDPFVVLSVLENTKDPLRLQDEAEARQVKIAAEKGWRSGEDPEYTEEEAKQQQEQLKADMRPEYHSQTVKNNYDPVWDEEFSFEITAEYTDSLQIVMWDYDRGRPNEKIGTLLVPVQEAVRAGVNAVVQVARLVDDCGNTVKKKDGLDTELEFSLSYAEERGGEGTPPEEEGVLWLNRAMSKIFKVFNKEIDEVALFLSDAIVRAINLPHLSLQIEKWRCGCEQAPWFMQMQLLPTRCDNDIQIQTRLRWIADGGFKIKLKSTAHPGGLSVNTRITNLELEWPLWLQMCIQNGPTADVHSPGKGPGLTLISIMATEKPRLKFDKSVVHVKTSVIPGLSEVVDKVIRKLFKSVVVQPNRIEYVAMPWPNKNNYSPKRIHHEVQIKGKPVDRSYLPSRPYEDVPWVCSELASKAVGRLSIKVFQGAGLKDPDSWGTNDPFCVCCVGGQKKVTQTKRNTDDPVWNEFFEFFVVDVANDKLEIEVFDADATKNDSIGTAVIRISDVAKHEGWRNRIVKLESTTSDTASLQLSLEYAVLVPDHGPTTRIPATNIAELIAKRVSLAEFESMCSLPDFSQSLSNLLQSHQET